MLVRCCTAQKACCFLFNFGRLPPSPTVIPYPSYKRTRVSEFLGSHVYQSSWVHTHVSEFLGSHTCIRVPGFIHAYQSSWVHTHVSEFLGSHTCIRVPGFTRVSKFLGSHTRIRVPGFTHVSRVPAFISVSNKGP